MRLRSRSDKRSEDKRRTNGPTNINKRFHEDEIDKRQEKRRRARNEWTLGGSPWAENRGRNEDRMGLPTQPAKFGRICLQLVLWDQGWEGEELKSHNPLDLQTRERGDKKELEGYTTRDNVRHGVSTVRLLHMPTEGPERQEVINKSQSAYRRTRASRSYQQRPEYLPKDQSVKKLSTKTRVPTEGPERQEVINKGQSAYRRTRASRSYQQRPESLPKDQSVKKLSTRIRVPKWNGQRKRPTWWKPHTNRMFLYNSSTFEHQQSWGSWQPNSRDQQATRKRLNETPYQNDKKMQEANHETTYDKTITIPNAR